MANEDSKRRRLESLETLIMHTSTNPNERQAAVGRWEAMTGEKWTGRPKYADNPNASRSTNNQQQRQRPSSGGGGFKYSDFEEAFRRATGSGFGGFNGFSGGGFGGFNDDEDSYQDPRTSRRQQQKREDPNWGKRGYYDFSHNECTDKQYEFVKSISDFFRWKCPSRHKVEFEEAQDFLNRYAELFKAFSPYSRNFSTLKSLFEALGIDWNQTKRTFKWRAFHER